MARRVERGPRPVVAAMAALSAVALGACVELADYGEFACAADGTCPAGYYCLADTCVDPASLAGREPFPCDGGLCPDVYLCVSEVGCVSPENLPQYTPFPCDDGVCPSDLVCLPDVGCVTPGELGEYDPFPCSADGGCPGGFVCIGAIGCVAEGEVEPYIPFACNADGTCPLSLRCVDQVGCVHPNECDPAAATCVAPRPSCDVFYGADGTGTTQCIPDDGTGEDGDDCAQAPNGFDDCAPGRQCVDLSTAGSREVCRQWCSSAVDCPSGETCVAFGIGALCGTSCDLDGSDACGSSLGCYGAVSPDGGVAKVCEDVGTLDEFEPCSTVNDCREGLWCQGGVCRDACDPTEPCGADAACLPDASAGICACEFFGRAYCDSDESCVLAGDPTGGYYTRCLGSGSTPVGAPCEFADECVPDAACFGTDEDGYFCSQICDAEHPCATGADCVEYATVNGFETDLGLCPLPTTCGDTFCDGTIGEDCETCPLDCPTCAVCGDAFCDTLNGENCNTCPQECGSCFGCGDAYCDPGFSETCANCAQDCGSCSGVCDSGITYNEPITDECLSINCCSQYQQCTQFGADTQSCVDCLTAGSGFLCDAAVQCAYDYCF